MRRLLLGLCLVLGCSRGGGGGGGTATSGSTVGTPDAALRASLAAAHVTKPAPPAPETPELVALGKALFFDKVISGNKNISCASCHGMGTNVATGDGLPVSMGEGAKGPAPNRTLQGGQLIARNAQPIWNAGLMETLFWDGRVHKDPATGDLRTPELLIDGSLPSRPLIASQLTSALAAQAMFPVATNEEMRGQPGTNEVATALTNEDAWKALVARLVGTSNGTQGGIAGYRSLFMAAFPGIPSFDAVNFGHAARAIAAFEKDAFTALDSPFDRYLGGDASALTAGQKRGALTFFGKARCASCHSGPLLTDLGFHALGVPQLGPGKFEPGEDRGRALITSIAADNYKFRTPPLRNVAATGPYMHDGAFATLESAVRHHVAAANGIATYDSTQLPALFAATLDLNPARNAARVAAIDPLAAPVALSTSEVADLLDFLGALTDSNSLSAASTLVPATVPSGLPVGD